MENPELQTDHIYTLVHAIQQVTLNKSIPIFKQGWCSELGTC